MSDGQSDPETREALEARVIGELLAQGEATEDSALTDTTAVAYLERIRHETEAAQRAGLRTWLMVLASIALVVELVALVCVVFFQGFKAWGFDLDTATLNIFATTLVIQTFLIIRIIATNLFPQDGSFFSPRQRRTS